MRIALGADHAGVALKDDDSATRSTSAASPITDFGTNSTESVDYPDFAATVAREVASGRVRSRHPRLRHPGIGMAIAANKVAGHPRGARSSTSSPRASAASTTTPTSWRSASGSRRRRSRAGIVNAFLDTPFAGGRHQRRVDKITALDCDAAPHRTLMSMPHLDAVDPDIAAAIQHEVRRQEEGLELIASENFVSPAVLEAAGSRADEQVRRGLSGQALLRRLRVRRRRRVAGDRAREAAVRRRARQRPAALGRAGQHGGLHRGAQAGRHDPRHEPRARRPPDARPPAELLGQVLQHRALRRAQGRRAARLRRARSGWRASTSRR